MVILLVALIVIGPKKLPEAGKQLGRAIREFRRVTTDMRTDLTDALGVDELRDAFDLNKLLGDDDPVPAVADPSPYGLNGIPGLFDQSNGASPQEQGRHSPVPPLTMNIPAPDGFTGELEHTEHYGAVAVPAPAFLTADALG